jgi:hypothetical protein
MSYEEKDVDLGNSDAFNVLVAYEDVAGGRRAQELLGRLTKAFPKEDSDWLCCAMWKFNEQTTPQRVEIAAEQATKADLIIIATHEREDLPPVLEEWVRRWLLKKAGRSCALVTLLERDESDTDGSQGVRSYFETVAQRAELAFFADDGNGRLDGAMKETPLDGGVSERDVASSPDPCHYPRGSKSEVDFN